MKKSQLDPDISRSGKDNGIRNILLLIGISLGVSNVQADLKTSDIGNSDTARGAALYENHCQLCHAETVHKQKDRKVGSTESLYAWVTAWSVHAGLNWGKEEVDDIVGYLDSRFYHFTASE